MDVLLVLLMLCNSVSMPRRQDRNSLKVITTKESRKVSMPRRQDRNSHHVSPVAKPMSGFHASQVGSKCLPSIKSINIGFGFHASQVGSKLLTYSLQFDNLPEFPCLVGRIEIIDYHTKYFESDQFPCLVGRIEINIQTRLTKNSHKFPCLVGRIEIRIWLRIMSITFPVSMPRRQDRNYRVWRWAYWGNLSFHASQVGSKLSKNFPFSAAYRLFPCLVGRIEIWNLIPRIDSRVNCFHASQVGSK